MNTICVMMWFALIDIQIYQSPDQEQKRAVIFGVLNRLQKLLMEDDSLRFTYH